MPVKRIAERVVSPFVGTTVDREKGIIHGVKLCGFKSENHRDYPPEVFRRDCAKYEGVPIYADHARERTIGAKLGWIASPRVDGDGTPRGDAHLLRSHPLYAQVMEAAERNPSLFGFSHVALCETSYSDGRERVEELQSIESVDLVAEPATTRGLFEARNNNGENTVITVKQLVERVTRNPASTIRQIIAIKKLVEMDDGAYGDAAVDGADDSSDSQPDDAVTSGFRAALMSVIEKALSGDLEPTAALKKIKTLLSAHSDATANDGDASADDVGNPTSESHRPAERPISASRDRLARLTETTRTDPNPVPSDGKAFAKWVSE